MDDKKEGGLTVLSIVVALILVAAIVYSFIAKAKLTDGDILSLEKKGAMESDEMNGVDKSGNQDKENMEENTNERVAKNGDTLSMNYTGRLEDGTVFDSNVDPKFGHVTPFEFTLGAGMVIAGWDEGLVGMKIGEKKTLTIPPEKAYGDRSPSPLIPANSTLIFDVEVLDIK